MTAKQPVVNIVVDDLYFQLRIVSVFERAGYSARVIPSVAPPLAEGAVWDACVWIFDMNARGEWATLLAEVRRKSPTAFLVAFGSHKEKESIRIARGAGADRVVTRARFVEVLPRLPELARVGGTAKE